MLMEMEIFSSNLIVNGLSTFNSNVNNNGDLIVTLYMLQVHSNY
jgi:hypothetical protein